MSASESSRVAVVRQILDALHSGDVDAVVQHAHADCIVETPHERDAVAFGGSWHGNEQVREAVQSRVRAMETRKFETLHVLETGHTVAVIAHGEYYVPHTNRSYEAEMIMLFDFKDDKVARYQLFVDPEHAKKAHQHPV